MNTKPDPRKPGPLSEAEIEAKRREGRRRTRERRLAKLEPFVRPREAAFACLLSPVEISRFIKSGRLPARQITRGLGQFSFVIERGDLIAFAESLEK